VLRRGCSSYIYTSAHYPTVVLKWKAKGEVGTTDINRKSFGRLFFFSGTNPLR